MDLDKINFDLILELLEWIVDGEHQVQTTKDQPPGFKIMKLS